MCRDRLFLDAKHDAHSEDMMRDMEQWRAWREHRDTGDMDYDAIRGALGGGDNYEGGEGAQDNADENEMHAGTCSDQTEVTLGQGKTE